ncbi:MAG: exodeoxyribonuclease III [Erysipelotrichaceae bacterium]
MKIITWNVNGLRACRTKGFDDYFLSQNADIFCVQETKMQPDQVDFSYDGYFSYYNSAVKKGYSSTALYSKVEPISVTFGIGQEEHDQEGRVITAQYDNYYVVCCYTPNSKAELERLDYRQIWEDAFLVYLNKLDKPVILCGDLNVAHQPIDLKNAKSNERNAGYTIEERNKFNILLENNYIDAYRYLYPDKVEYSWWSYRFNARANNAGWRIDYFVVSDILKDRISDCIIDTQILGSDHCPVVLDIEI